MNKSTTILLALAAFGMMTIPSNDAEAGCRSGRCYTPVYRNNYRPAFRPVYRPVFVKPVVVRPVIKRPVIQDNILPGGAGGIGAPVAPAIDPRVGPGVGGPAVGGPAGNLPLINADLPLINIGQRFSFNPGIAMTPQMQIMMNVQGKQTALNILNQANGVLTMQLPNMELTETLPGEILIMDGQQQIMKRVGLRIGPGN